MGLRKDIWRPAIALAPIGEIVARGSIDDVPLHWLPPMGSYRFLADPFGLWRADHLHIFAEAYDYRDRVGWIEVLIYDRKLNLVERRPVLKRPWHLSYPFLIEAEGETWMMPEGQRSGRFTLYRAIDFPERWEPAVDINLDTVPIDASPLFHNGLWWIFYAGSQTEDDKMTALHCAWAEQLSGPWTPHPLNPVRRDRAAGRPGGTPFADGEEIVLPVQDCTRTYGGAISTLRIQVTPDHFIARPGRHIAAPASAAPFCEGLHTLSAAGEVTLIDVKRTLLSPQGLAIELGREAHKLRRRLLSRAR